METKTFHIGDTSYSYSISRKKNALSVTYTMFAGDSFSDPNCIVEQMNLPGERFKPDHKGPNLEFGGIPYDYIPSVRTYYKPIR